MNAIGKEDYGRQRRRMAHAKTQRHHEKQRLPFLLQENELSFASWRDTAVAVAFALALGTLNLEL
jgi:hypothetical protein